MLGVGGPMAPCPWPQPLAHWYPGVKGPGGNKYIDICVTMGPTTGTLLTHSMPTQLPDIIGIVNIIHIPIGTINLGA
jgi:hypothetical protein